MAIPKQTQLWIVDVVLFVLLSLLTITGRINRLVLSHGGNRRDCLVIAAAISNQS